MTLRNVLLVVVVLVVGCDRADEKQDDTTSARQIRHVKIVNGKYHADPGIKLLDERPPETEKEFVQKFGDTDDVLFVKGEDRFYCYVKGRLQALDTINEPVESPK